MKISASRSLDDLHEQEKNQTLNSSKISPFSVKKLYKTHNRRTATATEEKSQKRVNKFDTNENLIKSNSATGAAAEQSNRIVSKRRNINFTLKKNNLNIIKDRFSWVVSSSVQKKQKNSYPFIPVSVLKTKKTRTINSQMGRLEKIFRSYLSKKRNFENDEQLKPNKLKKQKSNFPQIQSSAVAADLWMKNFGLIMESWRGFNLCANAAPREPQDHPFTGGHRLPGCAPEEPRPDEPEPNSGILHRHQSRLLLR